MMKAWLILTILLLTVPVAFSTETDSETTQEVLAVYGEIWNVTSEPLDASYLAHYNHEDYNHERVYVSEDPEDPAFYSYIRGEISRSALVHSEIEEGRAYYVFFLSGTVLTDDASGRVKLDLLDHSAIEKPSPTAMLLREGVYRFETDDSVNDHVTVKGGSVRAGYEPCKGGNLEILVSRESTYNLILNSGEWCCLTFKVTSGEVRTLPTMIGTTPYEISTPCYWARGEFEVGPGDYAFSQYTFPAGSEEDARFKAEVVDRLQTAAPDWADSWPRQSVDKHTRMAAYKLVSEDYMDVAVAQLEGDKIVNSNVIRIDDPELTGSGAPRKITLFAPAHERMALAFSYDPSRYAVMMDWGERPVYIAPDSRYEISFEKATQVDITAELAVSSVMGPDRFSTTVLMASENVPEPDGWGASLVVICAGVCLAVMAVLVWIGRVHK